MCMSGLWGRAEGEGRKFQSGSTLSHPCATFTPQFLKKNYLEIILDFQKDYKKSPESLYAPHSVPLMLTLYITMVQLSKLRN